VYCDKRVVDKLRPKQMSEYKDKKTRIPELGVCDSTLFGDSSLFGNSFGTTFSDSDSASKKFENMTIGLPSI